MKNRKTRKLIRLMLSFKRKEKTTTLAFRKMEAIV